MPANPSTSTADPRVSGRRRPSRLAASFGRAALADANAGMAASLPRSLLDVFRLHGEESAPAMLLVLALVCVLPVAGVGTVLGFAIIAIACRWHKQRRSGALLSARLQRVVLSEAWYRRCLRSLAWVYAGAERVLRTRWPALRRRSALPWWGAWIALMGVLILLPIPLGNVLPALSLLLLSLGWMYRDGFALIASAIVGVAAVAFAFLMAELLFAGLDSLAAWFATVV